MKRLIAPSILSADFNNLGKDVEMLNKSEADWIHCDIMDGIFVPNISFGIPVVEAVHKIAQKPLDVHLMIVEPDKYIAPFKEAGASIITVHYEVCTHLSRTIQQIKALGIGASVCLNPHTPVALLEDIISELDMVLLMSVNPGFGGQEFIENTYRKVSRLRDMIDKIGSGCLIEVDGGVNLETGRKLFNEGANVLVAGSFVFNAENQNETILKLKNLA
ncbi:Ribulose-phosphate 3-epimerase [hydrothermal vent metagenome]|uniref:ribulose-phosphate 3-epimerase n=1 Tax=hydrothermal vent metagenome TaxID=652676 RepID=A0A3B0UE13_9ZZZZ